MKNKIAALIENAVKTAIRKGLISETNAPRVEVELPGDTKHGDYATNIALILSSFAKQNPRKIAETIQANLTDSEKIIEKTQID